MTKPTFFPFNTFLSIFFVLGSSFLGRSSDAFSIAPVLSKPCHVNCVGTFSSPFSSSTKRRISSRRPTYEIRDTKSFRSSSSRTILSMYNLPPGGGGKNEIADIAKGAFSILLTIAFFVSPLGGLVLGIFNSFLVLLFVLPLIGTVGFQVWQKLNTVQAPCPVCGVPTTVMKSKNDANVVENVSTPQSICFSCGATLQANEDNTGINNVSGRKTIEDLNGPVGPRSSLFDVLTSNEWTTSTSKTENPNSKNKKNSVGIDKDAVIDVDVLDEEKPFQ